MRNFYIFVLVLLMASVANAQYIYTDFDGNQNEEFSGWPNAPTLIANPDPTGVNTSANVGEWIRTNEMWAHMFTELDGKIDFSTGNMFYLKVWSPITCNVLFKLEDKTNGATFMEVTQPVETANQWVQLDFDFTGAESGVYDKVVIFLDFMGTADNAFYFDDIEGPEYSSGPVPVNYIYTDFDANQNVEFTGWPNAPTLIANPDPTGVNTSANVGEWIRTNEMWAHMFTELDGKIDFSTGNMFYLKVWSPITCNVLFKLEDKTNSATFMEVSQPVEAASQWVQLAFDFTGAESGVYDKVVIFLDFMGTADNIYYFDDIEGPEYIAGPTPPSYIYTDFDAHQNEEFSGWPNAPTLIANPDPAGINTSANVGEWIRTNEMWAHMFTELEGKVDFTTGNTFYLKVWSPITCNVLFKLEDKTNSATFVEVNQPVEAASEWVQLAFTFPDGQSDLYDKVVIFLDFMGTADNTFYFDDIEGPGYDGGVEPKPLLELDIQDNFENDGYSTITEWKFKDPDISELPIIVDPLNAENHVADYIRSGNFEYTNAQFVLNHRMDLSERNKFQLKVFFPSTNDYTGDLTPTASIGLQNSLHGEDAWMTETEITLTVEEFDTWVTLQFDFSAASDSVNYDQVAIQFGGEDHFLTGQFHFDDLRLLPPGSSIAEKGLPTFDLFPNPVNNIFMIDGIDDIVSINIYNSQGQLVQTETENNTSVEVKNLKIGIYYVMVENAKGERFMAKMLKL
ncbi:MAG: T9SS type A sorting domain-containing protein [Sphingobacteriia bacterium]|nr:T9SS type A sorting domain-containing protein [Sphingobacteriia bacterium]